MTRARMTKAPVVVAAAVLLGLLAGCGMYPGNAARVGVDRIPGGKVDAVAQALCSANSGSGQPLASRGARQGALQVLIDSALSLQFGEHLGIEPDQEQVSAALAQNQQTIQSLPEDERGAFRDALKQYAEGQLILIEAGRRSLKQQGKSNIDDQSAIAEGRKLRAKFASDLEIEVDPRYGSYAKGTLQPGSGSLSVAVSDSAKDAASTDPSSGWVASLPASQKCG